MDKHISIKNLAADDRPREKLMQHGYTALSNSEILGILIGSGTKDKSAVQVCQDILNHVDGDLNKLAKLTVKDLQKFKGIGEAKAISIVAALELGRRRKSETIKAKPTVKSSKDAFQFLSHRFTDLNHEEFHIILLSRSNTIKNAALISKGGLSGTVADGKLIFKKALEESASAIILCHNHPSGNLKPSQADIQLTKKLKDFGAMIDLPVLDHIIFTDNNYFSFADEGLL
ncbi:MAG: DNA repair protein RadC [Putridiphycobacter sp.]|nr:DNA repair protein RadC [Putridiphycobacter sp.]